MAWSASVRRVWCIALTLVVGAATSSCQPRGRGSLEGLDAGGAGADAGGDTLRDGGTTLHDAFVEPAMDGASELPDAGDLQRDAATVADDAGTTAHDAGGATDAATVSDAGAPAGCDPRSCMGCCQGTVCVAPAAQSSAACGTGSCAVCATGEMCVAGIGCRVPGVPCSVTDRAGGETVDSCSGETVCVCPAGAERCDGTGRCMAAFPRTIEIGVTSVSLSESNGGDCWDGVAPSCFEPDPFVEISKDGTSLGQSTLRPDTRAATWDPPFVVSATFAGGNVLSFTVWDEDVAFDDTALGCTVTVSAAALRRRSIQCTAPNGMLIGFLRVR